MKADRVVLLDASDGPEGITIYTSDEEGVVDWSQAFPAVYVEATMMGAMVKLGPFSLSSIYDQLVNQLKEKGT